MSRPTKRVPKLGLHRATGKGRVVLSRQDHYTKADFGTPECHQEYLDLLAQWEANGYQPLKGTRKASAPATVGALLDLYREHLDRSGYALKDGKKTSAWVFLDGTIDRFKKRVGTTKSIAATAATFVSLRGWLEERVAKCRELPATANRRLSHLKRFLEWSEAQGHLDTLRVSKALLRLKTIKARDHRDTVRARSRSKRAVSWEDARAVAEVLGEPYRSLVLFQRSVGCRPGEAREMRWEDVEEAGEFLKWIPNRHKNDHHGQRLVYWVPEAAQEMLGERLLSGLVFPGTRSGKEVASEDFCRAVKKACEQLSLTPFTPHELRHGLITERANNPNLPLSAVAASVGHQNLQTTMGYVHASEEDAQAAVRASAEN